MYALSTYLLSRMPKNEAHSVMHVMPCDTGNRRLSRSVLSVVRILEARMNPGFDCDRGYQEVVAQYVWISIVIAGDPSGTKSIEPKIV